MSYLLGWQDCVAANQGTFVDSLSMDRRWQSRTSSTNSPQSKIRKACEVVLLVGLADEVWRHVPQVSGHSEKADRPQTQGDCRVAERKREFICSQEAGLRWECMSNLRIGRRSGTAHKTETAVDDQAGRCESFGEFAIACRPDPMDRTDWFQLF